jgi:hypothetical protein
MGQNWSRHRFRKCQLSADFVAKLPKCHAIVFPQIDKTSRNRRPMSSQAVTEVACEFIADYVVPSNVYSIASRTARKICVGRCKKTFATKSAQYESSKVPVEHVFDPPRKDTPIGGRRKLARDR